MSGEFSIVTLRLVIQLWRLDGVENPYMKYYESPAGSIWERRVSLGNRPSMFDKLTFSQIIGRSVVAVEIILLMSRQDAKCRGGQFPDLSQLIVSSDVVIISKSWHRYISLLTDSVYGMTPIGQRVGRTQTTFTEVSGSETQKPVLSVLFWSDIKKAIPPGII